MDQFHRTRESANAPIGQASPEIAAPNIAAQDVRDAFKAGWYVNAATDVEPAAEYLAGCEQVDWDVYASSLRSTQRPRHPSHVEELKAAYSQIAKLKAGLHECREYLEDHVDVVDGSYGEPAPNRAMQLVNMIDETMHGPGNF